MNARLYVGNLPEDASSEALRRRFAQHGAVADVHMAVDRSSGRARGYAFVTMASGDDARVAVDRLDGAMFEHRPLRVNEAGAEGDEPRPRGEKARPRVRITSQFRERRNMTYELDCRGVTLAIKVFPIDHTEAAWRMEACANDTSSSEPTQVTSAACSTRAAALEEVAGVWAQRGSLHAIDWAEVMEAMAAVRAI